MNLRFTTLILPLLTLAGCADNFSDPGYPDDGSISFSLTAPASTRGGNTSPRFKYETSTRLDGTSGQPLYIHAVSIDNTVAPAPTTRALPKTDSDFDEFTVTATVGDDAKPFMTDVKVSRSGSAWVADRKYFWPQSEAVTFYAVNEHSKPSGMSGFAQEEGKMKFSYTVPASEDGLHDAESQPDFIIATHRYAKDDVNGGCALIRFRHPLACLYFKENETLAAGGMEVVKVKITGLHNTGSCVFDGRKSDWTNKMISEWTLDESTADYAQECPVEKEEGMEKRKYLEVTVGEGDDARTVNVLHEPFMLLPHTKEQLAGARVEVTLQDGSVHTASLGSFEFEPGKVYVLNISNLDNKYPPVDNLQGMAGNNTVSLTWTYEDDTFPHIKKCGYTVEVVQKYKDKDNQTVAGKPVTYVWRYDKDKNPSSAKPYPDEEKDIDLFAYITRNHTDGADTEGGAEIDTGTYDEFYCTVYADYYNTDDNQYHQSPVGKDVTIKTEKSKAEVMFYIPEGAGSREGLLDDDDVAAADWFKRTYPEGVFVDKTTISNEEYKNCKVLWFPCGVSLEGGTQEGAVSDGIPVQENKAQEYEFWGAKASYVFNKMNISGTSIEDMKYFNSAKYPTPMSWTAYAKEKPAALTAENQEVDGWNSMDNYTAIFTNHICKYKNMYDNAEYGRILHCDRTYLSEDDCTAIKTFYRNGGCLLLTGFSIEKVKELGVLLDAADKQVDMPHIRCFNEVKQPSAWFVNPKCGADHHDHPIYKDLFCCDPMLFRDVYLSDYIDGDVSKGFKFQNHLVGRTDIKEGGEAYFLAGIVGQSMVPLLSNDAESCENNNIVWDNQVGALAYNGGEVIGTWGQKDTSDIGAIVEFKEKFAENDGSGKTRGTCICIGLGAYEFNNGTKYNPEKGVLNKYQSNIELMTKNAIDYLLTKSPDVE